MISCHTISYHVMSYHIISYHIISYHIISYHNITYHIMTRHDYYTWKWGEERQAARSLNKLSCTNMSWSPRHISKISSNSFRKSTCFDAQPHGQNRDSPCRKVSQFRCKMSISIIQWSIHCDKINLNRNIIAEFVLSLDNQNQERSNRDKGLI